MLSPHSKYTDMEKFYPLNSFRRFALILACALLAGFLPLSSGCVRDDSVPDSAGISSGEAETELRIRLDGVSDDVNAFPHELRIHNMFVYIYDLRASVMASAPDGATLVLENVGHVQVQPGPDGSFVDESGYLNGSWRVREGAKAILIFVNVPTSSEDLGMPGGLPLDKDILYSINPPEIYDLYSTADFFAREYLHDQDDSWQGGMMAGHWIHLLTQIDAAHPEVHIPLERRYARLDLRLRKVPELEGHELKITGMHLHTVGQAYLFPSPGGAGEEIAGGLSAFDVASGPMDLTVGSDYTDCLFVPEGEDPTPVRIYMAPTTTSTYPFAPFEPVPGYEVDSVMVRLANISKSRPALLSMFSKFSKLSEERTGRAQELPVTEFRLEATLDGLPCDPYTLKLVETDEDGTQHADRPLPVMSNKIYKVDATLTRRSLFALLDVSDWDDRAIEGPKPQSELSVAEPSLKIALSYNNGFKGFVRVSGHEPVYVRISDAAYSTGVFGVSIFPASMPSKQQQATFFPNNKGEISFTISVVGNVADLPRPALPDDYYVTVTSGSFKCKIPLEYLTESLFNVYSSYDYNDLIVKYGNLFYCDANKLNPSEIYTLGVYSNTSIVDALGSNLVVEEYPWTVDFSTDDGISWHDDPRLFSPSTTRSGKGDGDFKFSFNELAKQTVDPAENLRQQRTVQDYDLSTGGGVHPMTTANCYVINGPGTYRLPLVYGNAIKDGETNTQAFKNTSSPSGASSFLLQKFINHRGQEIYSPYIYNNAGCTPTKAALLWDDVADAELLTNVTLSPDKHYITFHVPASTITEGNAVVAVYTGNTIMWSWHIWVTNWRPDEETVHVVTAPDANLGDYDLGPYSLGETYARRSIVKGEREIARIRQLDKQGIPIDSTAYYVMLDPCPRPSDPRTVLVYNWGRKDPFSFNSATCEPAFDGYNFLNLPSQPGTLKDILQAGIFHPNYKFSSNYEYQYAFMDAWNLGYDKLVISPLHGIKTIYDPSPAGYKVSDMQWLSNIDENYYRLKPAVDETTVRVKIPTKIVNDSGIEQETMWYMPKSPALGSTYNDKIEWASPGNISFWTSHYGNTLSSQKGGYLILCASDTNGIGTLNSHVTIERGYSVILERERE